MTGRDVVTAARSLVTRRPTARAGLMLVAGAILVAPVTPVISATAAATWSVQRLTYDAAGVAPFMPAGAVATADSTVYVASSGSDDVVRVSPDGVRQPLRVPGLDRPRDVALDVVADRLWVMDTTDNQLVLITTSGSVVRSLSPGLKSPFGVVASARGVYVADSYNHRILLLDPVTGAKRWSQTACNGAFSRPRDVTLGPDGLVYVADTDHNRIAALDPADGSCLRTFGSAGSGPGQFSGLRSLASDGVNGLYVAEAHSRRVQHVSLTGGSLAVSAPGGPLQVPACVYVNPAAQRVGVCDTFKQTVHQFVETAGVLNRVDGVVGPPPAAGGFNQPFGVAYGPGGEMYVTDMFNHRVQKFAADGTFVRQWGTFGTMTTSFQFPRGITVTPDGGQVVVTDSENDRLAIYTPDGALVRTVRAQGTRTGWPHQTAIASDGTFWLADTNMNRVLHLSTSGAVLGQFNGGGQISAPRGIALDADGFVYVANSGRSRVEKYSQSGVLLGTLASSGTGATNVRQPWNLAISGSGVAGRIYIADGNNNRILVLGLDGSARSSITVGTGSPRGTPVFSSPRGVAVNPLNGDVAAADFYGYDVTVWREG